MALKEILDKHSLNELAEYEILSNEDFKKKFEEYVQGKDVEYAIRFYLVCKQHWMEPFVKLDLPEVRIAFEKDFKECTLHTFGTLCSKYQINLLIKNGFFSVKWVQKLIDCQYITLEYNAARAKIKDKLKKITIYYLEGADFRYCINKETSIQVKWQKLIQELETKFKQTTQT